MQRRKSVVLLSGGLDSTANLAICAERDEPVLALTFNYGQRAFARELEAARAFCEAYGVEHQLVEIPWLGRLGGSSLTDTSAEVPVLGSDQLDDRGVTEKSAKSVWVPNRNGVLINVAAAFAERRGAERVILGFNREEATTFPDNSRAYMDQATEALKFSTSNQVQVFSYTVDWDKREIVAELRKLKRAFPFERVWSCYHGGNQPCRTCESCQRFARAIQTQ